MMTVPIIIDFEASGFGKGSYPIEVGFSGRHGEGWCSLIRPENDWEHWDIDAAKVHHIPREILTPAIGIDSETAQKEVKLFCDVSG